MNKVYGLSVLALLVAACGGTTRTGGGAAASQAELKKAAAEQVANGTASGDVCAQHGWYGDKVCDTFCTDKDTDCVPSTGPTVCAEFIEQGDGVCSRKADDPCRFQDPDCNASTPPNAGGGDPVVCAAYIEAPDGVCSRPATDPCRGQDPDCVISTPPTGGPVVCPAYLEVPDGKCSRPATDPCRSEDPDCVDQGGTGGSGGAHAIGSFNVLRTGDAVACAEYIEAPDGVCSLPPNDPCLFHDPDCKPAK